MVFDEIRKLIDNAVTVALLPHVNADGDATGSCFALASALRKMGKTVDVIFEEYPRMSEVVCGEYKLAGDGDTEDYDLVFAIDCGDLERLGRRAELFKGKTACIDHHNTDGKFGGVNFTDPTASATGEIIFGFIKYLDESLFDVYIAECLHMAIAADSGCFKYSNTTAKTHLIAASLHEIGGDFAEINREIFDTVSLKKLKIQSEAARDLEMYRDGRVALYYLSLDRFCELELSLGDVDFISNLLKNIEGVSVGAFIREKEPGLCKVSLRTDEMADASVIAKGFGGGGHNRAAGFTLCGEQEEVKKAVVEAILSELGEDI